MALEGLSSKPSSDRRQFFECAVDGDGVCASHSGDAATGICENDC